MTIDSEKAYLLKDFAKDLPRRRVLRGLIALGAGGAGLAKFAESLAQATAEEVATLTIFCQVGNVPDVINAHSIPPFKKAYPNTAVSLEVGTSTVVYPKMLASRSRPVISGGMFNDIYAARGIKDKLWVKFNDEFVPNKAKVPANVMTPGGFGIPFHLTPFGIMYNPDRVDKPTSWTDLWNPKYKGRVSMWDGYFDAYIMAAIAAGKGPDVVEGIKAWEPHKQNIGEWHRSGITESESVHRGEVWLAPHWGAFAEQYRAGGKRIAFTIPKEGAVQWTNHMQCVTGFSPRATELSQRFMDTWLSDECQLAWITKTFLAPTSRSVKIPDNMQGIEALMSADEASKKLIRYDIKTVADRIPQLTQQINRTLKS